MAVQYMTTLLYGFHINFYNHLKVSKGNTKICCVCESQVSSLKKTMSSQDGHVEKLDQAKQDCNSEAHLLHTKVASQLGHYLSSCYLAEDGFLLKHVQNNKLGYVSLKLLTSFKKMRMLTRDWRVTLAGAHCSELLEVNEEGTKVKRREPLPKWLLDAPTTKPLLAWNLFGEQTGEDTAAQGLDHLMVLEKILKLLSTYGNVTSLRILHPGKELPTDLRQYAKRHTELGCQVCAVVEFECLEGARRAYDALRAEVHLSGKSMCVVPLGCRGSQALSCNQEAPALSGSEFKNRPGGQRQCSGGCQDALGPVTQGCSQHCSHGGSRAAQEVLQNPARAPRPSRHQGFQWQREREANYYSNSFTFSWHTPLLDN